VGDLGNTSVIARGPGPSVACVAGSPSTARTGNAAVTIMSAHKTSAKTFFMIFFLSVFVFVFCFCFGVAIARSARERGRGGRCFCTFFRKCGLPIVRRKVTIPPPQATFCTVRTIWGGSTQGSFWVGAYRLVNFLFFGLVYPFPLGSSRTSTPTSGYRPFRTTRKSHLLNKYGVAEGRYKFKVFCKTSKFFGETRKFLQKSYKLLISLRSFRPVGNISLDSAILDVPSVFS